jgi:hypothetical protein
MGACPHIPWSSYPRPVGIVPFCRYVCARLFRISCTDLVGRVQTGTVSCPNQSSRHACYQRRWPVWKLYASSLSLLYTHTVWSRPSLFLLYSIYSTAVRTRERHALECDIEPSSRLLHVVSHFQIALTYYSMYST